MAKEQQAAADARHFLSQFRSLTKFAESVADLGDIEGRVEGLKADEQRAKDAAATAKAKLDEMQKAVAAAAEDQRRATHEAARLTAEAKSNAEGVVANANGRAKVIVAEAEERKRAVEAEVLALQTKMNEEQKKAEKVLAETLTKRDAMVKEIEALRRRIA